MTTRRTMAFLLVAAAIALIAGLPTVGQAQQQVYTGTTSGGKPLPLHGPQTNKSGPRKSSKRTASKPRAAVYPSNPQGLLQRQWSLEDALPTRQADTDSRRNIPSVSTPQLGRIPMESGTFGFETQTSMKSGELSDGRRAPGLETVKRDPPSYFGLSLSVPTTNKSLLPPPIVPPWGRE